MKILIDMNLSPDWVEHFRREQIESVHWSQVGDPAASDKTIIEWARTNDHFLLTHDLDFGRILALTKANGPSVIQIRAQDVLPQSLGTIVFATIRKYENHLNNGALLVIDENRSRVRILPI